MSSLSLYNASVPTLDKWLGNLEHILKLGERHADDKGFSHDALLQARLAPDMFPLTGQVQTACSLAKACPHRLAGTTAPVYEDTEATFKQLYALVAKARAELATFTPEQINGREDDIVTMKAGPKELTFTGIIYTSGFIIPNVLFHVTTAYNIMRHNGVPLGKFDFFGGMAEG